MTKLSQLSNKISAKIPSIRSATKKVVVTLPLVATKKLVKGTVRVSKKKRVKYPVSFLSVFIFVLAIYAALTNPFSNFSTIQNPYTVQEKNGQFVLHKNFELKVHVGFPFNAIGFLKSGYYIVTNVFFGSKKADGKTVEEIIGEIHRLRFDPTKPYLISGDHFNVLYPRNLGVFYLSTLDPRIASSTIDWENRQKIYLLATAYSLDAYSKAKTLSTTIVPIGPNRASIINVYAYPSDALYSVLYALDSLQSTENLTTTYPFFSQNQYSLKTQTAAKQLLQTHREDIRFLFKQYKNYVYDTKTGLIKSSIHISSAKDITMRSNAFYDNVILWKTMQLMNKLGLESTPQSELDAYKQRIITAFWYEKGGYFLEDLSPESIQDKYYSSDWLVVLFTGFLDPKIESERVYYERSVAYIQKEKIDYPIGLKYQQTDRKQRQFSVVRFVVPEYGGSAIWSFWGNEYTKLLVLLYQQTGNEAYRSSAEKQIQGFRRRIFLYHGFPEVYDQDGNMLSRLFYKSIRQTGWVVNFEQSQMMLNSVKNSNSSQKIEN